MGRSLSRDAPTCTRISGRLGETELKQRWLRRGRRRLRRHRHRRRLRLRCRHPGGQGRPATSTSRGPRWRCGLLLCHPGGLSHADSTPHACGGHCEERNCVWGAEGGTRPAASGVARTGEALRGSVARRGQRPCVGDAWRMRAPRPASFHCLPASHRPSSPPSTRPCMPCCVVRHVRHAPPVPPPSALPLRRRRTSRRSRSSAPQPEVEGHAAARTPRAVVLVVEACPRARRQRAGVRLE